MIRVKNPELEEIVKAVEEKKGFNTLVLDVQQISSLTYYFILSEGHVERHLKAISDEIIGQMAKRGRKPLCLEGIGEDWVAIDFGEIIVHLFTPLAREKYRLEETWCEGEIVECELDGSRETCPLQ